MPKIYPSILIFLRKYATMNHRSYHGLVIQERNQATCLKMSSLWVPEKEDRESYQIRRELRAESDGRLCYKKYAYIS